MVFARGWTHVCRSLDNDASPPTCCEASFHGQAPNALYGHGPGAFASLLLQLLLSATGEAENRAGPPHADAREPAGYRSGSVGRHSVGSDQPGGPRWSGGFRPCLPGGDSGGGRVVGNLERWVANHLPPAPRGAVSQRARSDFGRRALLFHADSGFKSRLQAKGNPCRSERSRDFQPREECEGGGI